MAHINGSFASPYAGRLSIKFSGTYYDGNYRDAGFPGNSGASNLLLRAFCGPNDGTRKFSEPIDRNAPFVAFEMDYPGGGVSWPVGTQEVAHQNPGGLFSYGIGKLRIDIELRKK